MRRIAVSGGAMRSSGASRQSAWLAIALAAFALVALLSTVLGNAVGALRETYITIPVKLDRDALGLAADADASAIRGGDFGGLIKGSLRNAVPSAKRPQFQARTLQADQRWCVGLAPPRRHGGAIAARPDARHTIARLRRRRSMDEGLRSTSSRRWRRAALRRRSRKDDEVEIIVESNAFQVVLATIKQSLRDSAAALRRQARAQGRGVTVYEGRLKASGLSEEQRKDLEASLAGYKTQVAELTAQGGRARQTRRHAGRLR